MKPRLLISAVVTLIAALWIGWGAIGVAMLMLLWSIIGTRQYVALIGWAEGDEVVMMRSGWIWQQTTLARVNNIQLVAMHQSPFDRRSAMARVSASIVADTVSVVTAPNTSAVCYLRPRERTWKDIDNARAFRGRRRNRSWPTPRGASDRTIV